MSDSTQELYDMFPLEDKSDFLHAYIYLKYLDHFAHHALEVSGLPSKGPPGELHEDLDEMLKGILREIGDAAPDTATSVYHAKVVKLKDAIQFVTQKHALSLITPETVVPYKMAKDIILKNPDSIALGECACRGGSPTPCHPMDVCLFIGDPVASFLIEQNPKFRQITQEEAVSIIEAEHKRGHIQTAFFKKDLGRRFYCLCNCCGCCCMGVRMWNILGGTVPILTPSGYLAHVGDYCNGCGECLEYCQFNAISLDESGQVAVIDSVKCMGCGVCEDMCPVTAITLERDPSKGEPLDLAELTSQ
ncbi:MAG: 4Fe-4S dicluster domain-containing protein [Dehalococcoidia bacterium]|nr:MAG: 4Fe-4S dicluster domain-containing protein [Dehalococcoidia bacterium]